MQSIISFSAFLAVFSFAAYTMEVALIAYYWPNSKQYCRLYLYVSYLNDVPLLCSWKWSDVCSTGYQFRTDAAGKSAASRSTGSHSAACSTCLGFNYAVSAGGLRAYRLVRPRSARPGAECHSIVSSSCTANRSVRSPATRTTGRHADHRRVGARVRCDERPAGSAGSPGVTDSSSVQSGRHPSRCRTAAAADASRPPDCVR